MTENYKPCPLCGALICGHKPITEAGKRMSEIINGNIVAHGAYELRHSWSAFDLLTGESDGELYGSKAEAIKFKGWNADNYFYFSYREAMNGVSAGEASRILGAIRIQKERGKYHVERDYAPDTILPVMSEEVNDMVWNNLQRYQGILTI